MVKPFEEAALKLKNKVMGPVFLDLAPILERQKS